LSGSARMGKRTSTDITNPPMTSATRRKASF
jgi:hypothetical protein